MLQTPWPKKLSFPARLCRAASSSCVNFSSSCFRLVLVSGRNSIVSMNSDMERIAEWSLDGLIRTRLKTKGLPDMYPPTLNRLDIAAENELLGGAREEDVVYNLSGYEGDCRPLGCFAENEELG